MFYFISSRVDCEKLPRHLAILERSSKAANKLSSRNFHISLLKLMFLFLSPQMTLLFFFKGKRNIKIHSAFHLLFMFNNHSTQQTLAPQRSQCPDVHRRAHTKNEEEVSIRIESEIIGTSHCCVCGTNKGVFRRFDTENLYPIFFVWLDFDRFAGAERKKAIYDSGNIKNWLIWNFNDKRQREN